MFGSLRALSHDVQKEITTVKISIHERPGVVRLKLEGRVAGPGTGEFIQTWRVLAPSLDSRKLLVDLCGVLHMDYEARQLLTEIHKKTGAQLLADTPMTKYFAAEARRQARLTKEE